MLKTLACIHKIYTSNRVLGKMFDKYPPSSVAVAWTGGKDSTLLLWLVLGYCKKHNIKTPHILFINEGDVFPEILHFTASLAKQWSFSYDEVLNKNVIQQAKALGDKVIVRKLNRVNRSEIRRLGFREAFFYFQPESFVGNHLMKTVPLNQYILTYAIKAVVTGIRRDEQESRSQETYFSKREHPKHIRVHPILHFTERDVWTVMRNRRIPYVSLYEKGYRSLGAKSSTGKVSSLPAWEQNMKTISERSGRQQDKERIMEKLRKLGYM